MEKVDVGAQDYTFLPVKSEIFGLVEEHMPLPSVPVPKTKAEEEKGKETISNAEEVEEAFDGFGNPTICKLSSNRKVVVQGFKGKKLVSIREYYEKDGKQFPGTKGISLTKEQWTLFAAAVPSIDEAIKKMKPKLMN